MSSQNSGLWAVVPVKLLAQTKRRLTPLLSGEEREGLACAMLEDVLAALTRAPSLAGVAVITGDVKAAAIAQAAGVAVIADDENAGMTAAVTQAARHLVRREGMLVIPADVPLIAAADVESITAAHRAGPSVTLVAAGIDGGTNALACSPPNAIPFCFGVDSFGKHLKASTARGIEPRILQLAGVAQDIDRPDDIATFLRRASPTRTHAYLIGSSIADRFASEPMTP